MRRVVDQNLDLFATMRTYPGVFDPESVVQLYLLAELAYDERPMRSYYL